ncbi:MAG: hypothetical protein SOZ90_00565 [Candidatus Faecousia sp.]|nr:hypothetical protein [Candidatus Faecousia sp.]
MIFMKKITTRLLSLVLLGAFIPSFVLAAEWDLKDGSITVNAAPDTAQTVTQGSGAPTVDDNPVITSGGTTINTVTITAERNATANVTLENVDIDTSATGKAAITTSGQGNVNIELDGTNTVQSGTNHAGVEKTNGGTLTITDENKDGSLTATGGSLGAGIGGGKDGSGSNIAIEGGKVEAISVGGGAGIGGGSLGSGSNITIKGGKVTAQGGVGGAGIGGGQGGSGSNITISDGEVTATGAGAGAGIGGGYAGSGEGITIKGGEVTAQGDAGGAGIGGGISGTGSDVTISGDAQVKVQGGAANERWHKGAAIGNGGTRTTDGNEVSPNTSDLKVEGFIQIYEPGKNINTDTPDKTIEGQKGDHSWNAGEVTTPATCTTPGVRTYTCTKNPAHTRTEPIPALNHLFSNYTYDNNATCTQDGTETAKCERCDATDTRTKAGSKLGHLFETYVYNKDATLDADGTETAKCERCDATDTRTAKGSKLTGNTAETAAEARQDAYWVCGADGQALPYQSQVKDGVLTVTVQADTASLRGSTESLRQLEAQGITGIRFVTNKAQSDFTLSDLLASGTGSFTLTHDGDKVTFTLESTDISGILK